MALQTYFPRDPWLDNWTNTMERHHRGFWDLDPWVSPAHMWDYDPMGFPTSCLPHSKRLDQLKTEVEKEFIPKIGKDGFEISLDVQQFMPREISVRIHNNTIVIEGKHDEIPDRHGYVSRQFTRRYSLPPGYESDEIESSLSNDGVLTIKGPPQCYWRDAKERVIPIQKAAGSTCSIKSDY